MRLVLAAGKQHGIACLREILRQGHEVSALFSLREHAHENVQSGESLRRLAVDHDIPYYDESRLHDNETVGLLRSIDPDFMLIVKWRRMIPESVYAVPKHGTAILHDSLLPKYRGFAPLNWAIINGETETGATMFYVRKDVDSGPIIAQRKLPIQRDDTAADVDGKIVDLYASILQDTLPKIAGGRVEAVEQDHSQATFCCSRTPEDGLIDWTSSATRIHNLVRGLAWPFPGAFTFHHRRKVTVWSAAVMEQTDRYVGRMTGRVVRVSSGVGVWVLAGQGTVELRDIQIEDGPIVNASETFRSIRDTFG